MKLFFFLLLKFLIISICGANNEYNISNFSIHTSKKIETNKGYKFSISQTGGSWQDNKEVWKVKLFFTLKNLTIIL